MRLQHLLLLPFLALACTPAPTDSDAGMEAIIAQAAMTIDTTGIQLPIYQNFEQLEPLFEQQEKDLVYVINFWATWCKPCLEEMPYFEELHENYDGKKVQVVLVSLDFEKDLQDKLIPFLQRKPLKMPVLAFTDSNYNNWIGNINDEWDGAIPATIVYRGDRETLIAEAFTSYSELQNVVIDFLQN